MFRKRNILRAVAELVVLLPTLAYCPELRMRHGSGDSRATSQTTAINLAGKIQHLVRCAIRRHQEHIARPWKLQQRWGCGLKKLFQAKAVAPTPPSLGNRSAASRVRAPGGGAYNVSGRNEETARRLLAQQMN